MHLFQILFLAVASFAFAAEAIVHRSLLALGLLAWVLAILVPLVAR